MTLSISPNQRLMVQKYVSNTIKPNDPQGMSHCPICVYGRAICCIIAQLPDK